MGKGLLNEVLRRYGCKRGSVSLRMAWQGRVNEGEKGDGKCPFYVKIMGDLVGREPGVFGQESFTHTVGQGRRPDWLAGQGRGAERWPSAGRVISTLAKRGKL